MSSEQHQMLLPGKGSRSAALDEAMVSAMQVMDLELEILDVWEEDGAKCERVRNR